MNPLIIPGIIGICIYLLIMLAIVQCKHDTSIANFVWGGGVLLIALYTFFKGNIHATRHILATALIILWAGRLALYVYLRYKGNDPRYQNWKHRGVKALCINFGYIFSLQTMLLCIMAVPIILINISPNSPLTRLDYWGIALWLVGYYFEAVSDYQMFVFMRNSSNKGKVLQTGLWAYSRHPNYFGEVVMWWGVFLIALNVPNGFYAIVAPVTITFLLLFVTGIPWIEKAMAKNAAYQEYTRHTSIFIPWFPQ